MGSNFIQEVHEAEKDVVLYLYKPKNCPKCVDMGGAFDQAAWELKSNKKIQFAKLDVSENEIPLTIL